MSPILFFSLVIILSVALPWWPYSAYGRLRHHRPWDWLFDNPSWEDFRTPAKETSSGHVYRTWLDTPEASQKAARKPYDSNSETHMMQDDATWQTQFETMRRQLEEHWVAQR
jgi:hypothetical protein